jgi:hypothetical protein
MIGTIIKLLFFPFWLPFKVLGALSADNDILEDIEDDADTFGED